MRKVFAWLGVATLFMVMSRADAANDVLKPYVVMILDTSGSMGVQTGSGPTSCGRQDTRLNHATCAINNIVSSYGDMVFALGRFREINNSSGTAGSQVCDANLDGEGNVSQTYPLPTGGDICNSQGPICSNCDVLTGTSKACTSSADCFQNSACTNGFCDAGNIVTGYGCKTGDSTFELLAPLVDGGNESSREFVDGACNACSVTDTANLLNPEVWGVANLTFTPLAASLRGAQRYWEGLQAQDTSGTQIWSDRRVSGGQNLNNPGFDPINRDPAAHVFLSANDVTGCNATAGCAVFDAESGPECADALDSNNDNDNRVNDGCPAVGAPETACDDAIDNDNDGTVNDGCQAWCTGTACCCAQQCRPYITILLTDGQETCDTSQRLVDAAADLYKVSPRNDQLPILSISRSNNVVTLTTAPQPALPHHFAVGNQIRVFGPNTAPFVSFNGTFIVESVPTPTTLTYTQFGTDAVANGIGAVQHTAFNNIYTVKTIPIGFGVRDSAFEAQIEALAHAGGAPNIPNAFEGYYAQDEAELELAISDILADSVRSELCNAKDDDCDVRIDEDFPNKGMACNNNQLGICARAGTLVCKADGTGVSCTAPTVAPGTEGPQCNQLDDDCDGRVDEGLACQGCVPTGEICDNVDQDCDGVADRSCRCVGGTNAGGVCNGTNTNCSGGGTCQCSPVLTRACGIGTCAGTETCTAGTYQDCDADMPETEQCDGVDNDCDGICDGFQEACSMVGGTVGPGTNNPGHPLNNPIPENACRPGLRSCPLKANCTAGNTFTACAGEVMACVWTDDPTNPRDTGCDLCNGIDDDCDNEIDEDFLDEDCSTNCGIGRTACEMGNIVCDSTAAEGDATCDNIDDDCDSRFDEDWECVDADNDNVCDPCGVGSVCNGMQKCQNGVEVCDGGPINPEVCNCLDDDCDGETDEDPSTGPICGATGGACVNCQCAFGCAEGEFPCPLGKKCEITGAGNFCVNDPCFNVTCGPVNGNAQSCIPKPGFPNEPQCVDTCSLINDADTANPFPPCPTGFVCFGPVGECRPDTCATFPERCTANEACVNGQCVSNPCAGVTCDTGQYCLGGACVASCADVDCPTGQRCRQGTCETDPCGSACPFGQACNDTTGQCIEDPCKFRNCPDGQWCNPNAGICEDDPCVTSDITCPNAGEVCRGGSCFDPDTFQVDAANEAHVTVGGGGGCNTSGGAGSGLVVLAFGLLLMRRRRAVVGGAL